MGEGKAVLAVEANEQKILALPSGEIRPGTTPLGNETPEYLPESDDGYFTSGKLYDEDAPGLTGSKRL